MRRNGDLEGNAYTFFGLKVNSTQVVFDNLVSEAKTKSFTLPIFLVVKKGSKILLLTCREMPTPVSETVNATRLSSRKERIFITRVQHSTPSSFFWFIASRALVTRWLLGEGEGEG